MAGSRRCVRDENDATKLLDAWQNSGMELRAFAESRRVDGRSLRHWAGKLDRDTLLNDAPEVRLLELTLPQPAPMAHYRILVGELAIELDDHFQEHTLRRLLDLVARC